MKREYLSGKSARENFEHVMTALFRVPKSAVKDKPKPGTKEPKKADKE